MSIHLYKHNEDAYRAVETMLEEKQMAAVIHPTGTGKSMIAFPARGAASAQALSMAIAK